MPHQNRVTPFGTIIADPARGMLMGNRGCLHDRAGRVRRPFQSTRWILCQLSFKGRQRPIMAPGQYTELFFLDEATALAAGHRPCAECSRARFNLFRALWAAANLEVAGSDRPPATVIDAALHRERVSPTGGKATYTARLGDLPGGVFVAKGEEAYLWFKGLLWPWQPGGYGAAIPGEEESVLPVLTPRSVVQTLVQGYPVLVHPSAAPGVNAA